MPESNAGRSAPLNVLRVAVPAPLHGSFDYLPPSGVDPRSLQPGMRLRVPFGRRRLVGVLLETATDSALPRAKLRPALELLDDAPVLDAELLALCRWAADYYHHPLGEVLAAALPALLRAGRAPRAAETRIWSASDAGRALDLNELRRAPRQQALLHHLRLQPAGADEAALRAGFGETLAALKPLAARGLIERRVAADAAPDAVPTQAGPALSSEQAAAVAAVAEAGGRFQPLLLEGITGSGKTEVYLQAIAETLARGRQALVLIPEIGLTPQLVARFRERLGGRLAVAHSGLSDGERLAAWLAAHSARAGVVIGTRSAVFMPLPRLGLVVVDEEHDGSYKQQDGFRYSARDLAIRRAQRAGVPVLLGSATPSLESLHNAASGRYRLLHLSRRTGSAELPVMQLLDMRGQWLHEGLSAQLLTHMRRHLEAGGQCLLFLNRRGYAPTLMCHACGWVADCRRCDAHMTLHAASKRLRCHHCGAERAIERSCPQCRSAELIAVGEGTERVEQALQEHFPGTGIARMDRDTTRRKGELDRLLADAHSGAARILIGTQMLAKGHDFPGVSLVGILNADGGLYGSDFRAAERMAQLVIQVAGRAGRAERPGEVYIQTHQPQHPLLLRLVHEGYRGFASAALDERRAAGYPPFGFLALLRAESPQPGPAQDFLQQAADAARTLGVAGVELWGPVPAPMERRAGRVRAQLLLQAAGRRELHALLRRWVQGLDALPGARRARWSLDVDPQDLF